MLLGFGACRLVTFPLPFLIQDKRREEPDSTIYNAPNTLQQKAFDLVSLLSLLLVEMPHLLMTHHFLLLLSCLLIIPTDNCKSEDRIQSILRREGKGSVSLRSTNERKPGEVGERGERIENLAQNPTRKPSHNKYFVHLLAERFGEQTTL